MTHSSSNCSNHIFSYLYLTPLPDFIFTRDQKWNIATTSSLEMLSPYFLPLIRVQNHLCSLMGGGGLFSILQLLYRHNTANLLQPSLFTWQIFRWALHFLVILVQIFTAGTDHFHRIESSSFPPCSKYKKNKVPLKKLFQKNCQFME